MECSAIRTRKNKQGFDNKSQGYTGRENQWEQITTGRGARDKIRGLSASKTRIGEKSWDWMGQG